MKVALLALLALASHAADAAGPGWDAVKLEDGDQPSHRCGFARSLELSHTGSWSASVCDGDPVTGKLSEAEAREINRLALQVAGGKLGKPQCKQVKKSARRVSLDLTTLRGQMRSHFEILRIEPRTSRQSCVLGARGPVEALHARLTRILDKAIAPPAAKASASPTPQASPAPAASTAPTASPSPTK